MDRITDRAQAFANRPKTPALTTNTYIEIPEYIKTYRTLINNSYLFNAVQQQYLDVLDKLAKTCRPLAAECNHLNLGFLIKDTQEQLINIGVEGMSDRKDWNSFFCYTKIRQFLIEIEEFLRASDDQDKKILVYSQLYYAFGVCLQGFTSKVYDVYQYMERQASSKQDINRELYSKCNELIKDQAYKLLPMLQEEGVLEQYRIGDEVHIYNGLVETGFSKFNLNKDADSQLSTYDTLAKNLTVDQEQDIFYKLDYFIPRYKICDFLTEIWYKKLIDVMEVIGINDDLTKDINPTVFTFENTNNLDIYFLSLINQYFDIQDDSLKLDFGSIAEENPENYFYSFANIKDTLHKFIATNIENLPHNMLNKTFHDKYFSFDIHHDDSTIYSMQTINSGYFYKTNPKSPTSSAQPIDINDLSCFSTNGFKALKLVQNKLKVPVVMQALKNKKSSVDGIYNFFNNEDNIEALRTNKYVMKEFRNSILSSEDLQEKILEAIILSYITAREYGEESYFRCAKFFIDLGFISNSELYNVLIKRGLVSIATYIAEATEDQLYKFVSKISTEELKQIFSLSTLENKIFDKFNSVIIQAIKNKNFLLLNTLLENDKLFKNFLISEEFETNIEDCIDILFSSKQDKLLGKILSESTVDIKHFSSINILHYATICHDEQVLKNITSKLYPEELQGYLISKDRNKETPFAYAAREKNMAFFEVLKPYITKEMLMQKIGRANKTFFEFVYFEMRECTPIFIPYYTLDMLKPGRLSETDDLITLMFVVKAPFDDKLLDMFDDKLLNETTAMGNNLLTYATKYKRLDWIKMLLGKCNEEAILHRDEFDTNILMMAVNSKNLQMVDCLLDNLSPETFKKLYLQRGSKKDSVENILQQKPSSEISQKIKQAYIKIEGINNSN